MQIASHNSMTYCKPLQWWLRPFAFMARCQSKNLAAQLEDYGARLFDLRVRFDRHGDPVFAHGLMTYSANPFMTVAWLGLMANKTDTPVYAMISLEWQRDKDLARQQKLFAKFIDETRDLTRLYGYGNLHLCGGLQKLDWTPVPGVNLPAPPSYTQMVASTTWRILDDWCPWLYARLKNRQNRARQYQTQFLSLDFLQY